MFVYMAVLLNHCQQICHLVPHNFMKCLSTRFNANHNCNQMFNTLCTVTVLDCYYNTPALVSCWNACTIHFHFHSFPTSTPPFFLLTSHLPLIFHPWWFSGTPPFSEASCISKTSNGCSRFGGSRGGWENEGSGVFSSYNLSQWLVGFIDHFGKEFCTYITILFILDS